MSDTNSVSLDNILTTTSLFLHWIRDIEQPKHQEKVIHALRTQKLDQFCYRSAVSFGLAHDVIPVCLLALPHLDFHNDGVKKAWPQWLDQAIARGNEAFLSEAIPKLSTRMVRQAINGKGAYLWAEMFGSRNELSKGLACAEKILKAEKDHKAITKQLKGVTPSPAKSPTKKPKKM